LEIIKLGTKKRFSSWRFEINQIFKEENWKEVKEWLYDT
jgi:hypothetical protein